MALVNIAIRDRIAIAPAGVELVCNNPTDSIRFDFDEEWSGVEGKTARFSWEGKYLEVSFIGDTVKVPEIYKTDYVYVGVYGVDITSTPVKLLCKRSILCHGDTVRAPLTDPFYEEFCDRINAAEATVSEMQEVIDSTYTYLEEGGSPLNIPGNAGTATKLHTPVKIGEASFDGSADVTLDDIGAASENHTHTPEEIGAAPEDHTHTLEDIGAAAADHTHEGYAAADHTHEGYAAENHTHSLEEIGAAASDHTHSEYAASSHTHAASNIKSGTFADTAVKAKAGTDYTTERVRNIVMTETDPGAGTSSSHANGTVVLVYE